MSYINESGLDRIIRIVLGFVLLYLGFSGVVGGSLGVFLIVLGFIPLLTGVVGWCPLYALFKIRTNQKA
ncbi:MAG TPA: DUF2892 domain-containing protein [Anaerolineales bacterium]|jgi:membrane-bound ClpP family serine protease|nr:DUF2892 domain-containing protein [Anaerolineales bacterium]